MIMLGSTGGSIADLVRGWRPDSGKRWLMPLAVFLCLFGLVLILATTVEALAPFAYAIFVTDGRVQGAAGLPGL